VVDLYLSFSATRADDLLNHWPVLENQQRGMPRMHSASKSFIASSTVSLVTMVCPRNHGTISATVGARSWHGGTIPPKNSTMTAATAAVSTSDRSSVIHRKNILSHNPLV